MTSDTRGTCRAYQFPHPTKLGGSTFGAERPDGEAPKPPQVTLEMSLNHEHPACTLAPAVTLGLKHPSCGAGRGLIRSASPKRRPPSVRPCPQCGIVIMH
jgi:hypothetical protein